MNFLTLKYNPTAEKLESTPRVKPPLSKSIAARELMVAYMSGKKWQGELPDCDDTRYLHEALDKLQHHKDSATHLTLDLGSGATSLRFFAAACAATPGCNVEILCSEQLRRRPMAPLIEVLRSQGAYVACKGHEGYPPLLVDGRCPAGGNVDIDAALSSQFTSALMLTAPYAKSPVTLHLTGDKLVSKPYIDMTAQIMKRAGADVSVDENVIAIANIPYSKTDRQDIEADWSAASYLYEFALLTGRRVEIEKLTPPEKSLQGDSYCADIFMFLGVRTEWHNDGSATLIPDPLALKTLKLAGVPLELNLENQPDLTPAIAVALAVAGVKFRITGVGHLQIKESNRLAAICNELENIGIQAEYGSNWLASDGRRLPAGEDLSVATYGDHRIAMAFAMAATRLPYLAIRDPRVVDKSFPTFWDVVEELF